MKAIMVTPELSRQFWSYVERRSQSECWPWRGGIMSKGYGMFNKWKPRLNVLAHRWAYTEIVGPIPDGLVIDHLCDNRKCVNPSHMRVVTQRENILRGRGMSTIHASKSCCPRGHPYDEAFSWRKARSCSVCRKAGKRISWHGPNGKCKCHPR